MNKAMLSACALLVSSGAWAQAYPSKPIRILLETAAGSVFDTALRVVTPPLSQQLGQQVLLENRPGASGVVSAEACAKSPPDGYTACSAATNSFSYNPHVFAKLPYDVEKDFKPVANFVLMIDGLVTKASLPVSNVKELQALAAAKPGSLNFGTLGDGSSVDVFRQLLGEQWKTSFVGIPYKGGANLTATGLMTGEIDLSWGSLGSWIAGINGGKIKLVAASASKRLPQFPNVPLFSEVGLTGIGRVFFGMAMPAGTPDAIVNRMNAEVVKVLQDPKVAEGVATRFLEASPMSVSEFTAFLKEDRERAGVLVRKYNVPKQ